MTVPFTRRALVRGLSALLAAPAMPARAAAVDSIGAIERSHGGRLGVFVLDTGTGRTLAHRADERFLLQSTFKGILAAMVLSRIDAGQDGLDRSVPYSARDLLPASPVTKAHLADGAMTVAALCQAILERSDNAAANLLLARVGGPSRLTAYVHGLGDPTTRFDRYELVGGWSGTKDTTTPRAIVGSFRTIVLGNALHPGSRLRLQQGMAANVPGRTRLRAAFPATWTAGDRTGTSNGVCNDVAVAWPPGRAPLVMAAYYEAANMDMVQQEAVVREVGSAIVAWEGQGP